jgi:hypothetical protein
LARASVSAARSVVNDSGLLFDAGIENGEVRLAGQRRFGFGQNARCFLDIGLGAGEAFLVHSLALRQFAGGAFGGGKRLARFARRGLRGAQRVTGLAFRLDRRPGRFLALGDIGLASPQRLGRLDDLGVELGQRFFCASRCAAGVGASARAV